MKQRSEIYQGAEYTYADALSDLTSNLCFEGQFAVFCYRDLANGELEYCAMTTKEFKKVAWTEGWIPDSVITRAHFCKHCHQVTYEDTDGTHIDVETGGDVCGWDGGNEPHEPVILPIFLNMCECDNTHDNNDTVCQWCWANGRRKPSDPEIDPKDATVPHVLHES